MKTVKVSASEIAKDVGAAAACNLRFDGMGFRSEPRRRDDRFAR